MTQNDSVPGPELATTFAQLVRAAAGAYGDAAAISLKGDTIPDDAITYSELDARSATIARGLIARGVGKGSRVGFIHGNGPSFAVTMAAISRIGAIAVPISTLIKSNELVRVLRQSDVGGLIVQRKLLNNDYVERICDALPDLRDTTGPELRLAKVPFLRWIVSTGPSLPAAVHDIAWLTDVASTVSEELLREAEAETHSTDQMIEIYTSGSMALPKGVKHSHGTVMFRTHYMRKMTNLTRGQDVVAFLPMFWVGGMMMALLPGLEVGGVVRCTEGTSTNSRTAMGSVLSPEDLALMGYSRPYWGLGMTETLGPYSYGDVLRDPRYPLCAPLDHIAEGYEVRLWADGRVPQEGEPGEVQVRGYPLTSALHKTERDKFFEPDGFYRTGDLAIAEGSRILFIGRDGDIIKTAGSNVSPAEVEMELQAVDGVHSAYVVGLPDQERGQLVVAAVVPREGITLDFDAIQKQLRQRLSSFKVPRAYVQITREEVPMLHSNKVSRRIFASMLAERLGRVD